jgi:hypothetical protein
VLSMRPADPSPNVRDEFCPPGLPGRASDEQSCWKAAGIKPIKIARKLWVKTRLSRPTLADPTGNSKPHDAESSPPA